MAAAPNPMTYPAPSETPNHRNPRGAAQTYAMSTPEATNIPPTMNDIMTARLSRASDFVEMVRLHAGATIKIAPIKNPRTAATAGVSRSACTCTVPVVPVRYPRPLIPQDQRPATRLTSRVIVHDPLEGHKAHLSCFLRPLPNAFFSADGVTSGSSLMPHCPRRPSRHTVRGRARRRRRRSPGVRTDAARGSPPRPRRRRLRSS